VLALYIFQTDRNVIKLTFFYLNFEAIHFLHSFLQFIFGWCS